MAFQKLQSGEFMVIGALPKDAELKQVGQKNSSKTSFSVKVSESVKPDGSKEANWTNCVAWHDMARICAEFCKGDVVLAVGKIEEREWEGKKYKDLVVSFAVKAGVPAAVADNTLKPATGNPNIDAADDPAMKDFEELMADGEMPF